MEIAKGCELLRNGPYLNMRKILLLLVLVLVIVLVLVLVLHLLLLHCAADLRFVAIKI